MKRLIVNILLFIVAIFLLVLFGFIGIIYSLIWSVKHFSKVSFMRYWADLFYSINIGIDQLGNVLLSAFLNNCAIKDKEIHRFGDVDDTISHVLAVNYFASNTSRFGTVIVLILEAIDKNHMKKSL